MDKLKTYFVPAFTYSRSTLVPGSPMTSFGARGSVGAQYPQMRCFSVYGELGAVYMHSTTTSILVKSSGNTWGTRSAVGVILYLNAK